MNTPLAVLDQRYVAPQPVSLIMKEKGFSWSGDDFSIKEANTGQVYFKIDGKAFSLSQKKTLLDYSGAPIACFEKPLFHLSLTPKFDVNDMNGQRIFSISRKMTFLKSKFIVEALNRADGMMYTVSMKGDWRDKSASIYIGEKPETGRILATISRKLSMKHIVLDQQDYVVSIQPGVDSAFIVLLVLAFDECENEKK